MKERYKELQKKHGLPRYEDLDREFELLYVGAIQEVQFVLRFVRRRMNDKLVNACTMVQSLLQPNPGSFVNLQESSFLSKEEKRECSELLKEIMEVERWSVVLDVESDERKEAEFVKELYKRWLAWKPRVVRLGKKVVEGWKSLELKEEKQERYFS